MEKKAFLENSRDEAFSALARGDYLTFAAYAHSFLIYGGVYENPFQTLIEEAARLHKAPRKFLQPKRRD